MFSSIMGSGDMGPVGQQEWTTPGVYSFIVPDNVYSVSFVLIRGGQGGGNKYGGDGGNLRYMNNIPVTPKETLTVSIYEGGTGRTTDFGNTATHCTVKRGSTILLATNTPLGNGVGGGEGGSGGSPLSKTGTYGTTHNGGGGGGAGGYSGPGGDGGDTTPTAGQGGGGGGGGRSTRNPDSYSNGNRGWSGKGGGGVGLYGEGINGDAGVNAFTPTPGLGGSSGLSGAVIGGKFGGGGAGDSVWAADGVEETPYAGVQGGSGAGRAIWGYGREYPSTMTGDM